MEIKRYEKNAKIHSPKQLELIARSIQRFGWQQPIKVGEDNVIIVGHGRELAHEKYGIKYNLPNRWIIDKNGKTISGKPEPRVLTSDEEKAYRIADNEINAITKNDNGLLMPELKDLFASDQELFDITAFNRDLMIEPDDKDDNVPELPDTTQTVIGDIYQLGEHRIMCGDSTQPGAVLALLDGNKAAMVFTDPPYNVDYSGSGENTSQGIMNDKMSTEAFEQFLIDFLKAQRAGLSEKAGCYIFHSHKTAGDFRNAIEKAGYKIDTELIWNKPSAGMGMNHYRTKHEPFFYCGIGEKDFYGDRTGTTVWKVPKDDEQAYKWFKRQEMELVDGKTSVWTMKRAPVNEYVHPTQKPVELVVKAITNSSKPKEIVMDLFLGSGTTLIACEKSGRICAGMELDPKFIDVIVTRYCNFVENNQIIKNGKKITWTQ